MLILSIGNVVTIIMISWVLNDKQHDLAAANDYNFDHPDAFDFELLIATLKRLKEGRKVEVPIYNFVTHSRENRTKTMYGANVIIFEGILCFYNSEVLKMLDMKVFVDTDSDIRLARRLRRDITQRGRELVGVLKQYCAYVKPSFDYYIAPSMTHADIIVPRGGENAVAIELIVQHVHTRLQERGLKLRENLVSSCIKKSLPQSLYKLPSTPQIQGLHTFIRNKDTPRDEFIFYSKRLMRLVIEFTLSLFPFKVIFPLRYFLPFSHCNKHIYTIFDGIFYFSSCNHKLILIKIVQYLNHTSFTIAEVGKTVMKAKLLHVRCVSHIFSLNLRKKLYVSIYIKQIFCGFFVGLFMVFLWI
ncbi:hypothetical protein J437_LFUL018006 [Ladona fulva]|uniref:uridine/cytidine kinase n=1 Tax=Ladona fulva TaxID=123851 RepID=A0A8K0P8L4_LADFU|nr:hypothetical protein J437_LFUL018006 [Ladona fulva]